MHDADRELTCLCFLYCQTSPHLGDDQGKYSFITDLRAAPLQELEVRQCAQTVKEMFLTLCLSSSLNMMQYLKVTGRKFPSLQALQPKINLKPFYESDQSD